MKNFIFRFLGTYIMYTIIIAIWFSFLNDNYKGVYGKEGAFRWGVFLIYPVLALVGSVMGYFVVAYISKKVRIIILLLMMLFFCGNTVIHTDQDSMTKNTFVGTIYNICVLGIPQFVIPNFNLKKHRLDNDKEYLSYYLFCLFFGYGLLVYYLFFFDGLNFMI